MVKGTSKSGFEFEYDINRLDDMRFVDVMAVVVSPDTEFFDKVAASSQLTEMLLGKELKGKLYKHIGAKHDGRVPRAALEAELEEMMKAAGKDAEKN